MKIDKTNALRLLDSAKVAYTAHPYDPESGSATETAALLGVSPHRLFKTLVTVAADRGHYVFMIPADAELDLKKAARAAGVKSLAMLPQKELLPLTGYVHGGCSPLGMKKYFPTFLHSSAAALETICCSAGKRGLMMELSPAALCRVAAAVYADVTVGVE